MPRFNDLTGKRFGRLVVIARAPNRGVKVNWLCQCDCGNQSIAFASDLRSGRHQSCGCLQKECMTKHGHAKRTTGYTITYSSWASMKYRCCNPKNPKFQYYGGRGISICDRWIKSFEAFLCQIGIILFDTPLNPNGIDGRAKVHTIHRQIAICPIE